MVGKSSTHPIHAGRKKKESLSENSGSGFGALGDCPTESGANKGEDVAKVKDQGRFGGREIERLNF